MLDGYIKTAAASPEIRVGDCAYNVIGIKQAIDEATGKGVQLLVLPELCVTGYTCDDLFAQTALQEQAESALFEIAEYTKNKNMVVIAGLPLAKGDRLFNTAAVLCGGEVLGIVPKTFLPNYGEYYEQRYFEGAGGENTTVELRGKKIPFGTKLLFACTQVRDFVIAVEICEDLFVPVSPSSWHSLAGATVIANLSASDELIGKANFRRSLVVSHSVKNVCAYVYCSAGSSESTTDIVFSAHSMIVENGTILAESRPFGPEYCETEIDVKLLAAERRRLSSVRKGFDDSAYQTVPFSLKVRQTKLTRRIHKTPFVPDNMEERAERCNDILNIQVTGLRRRIEKSNVKTAVIGISGGLDSTLALLVACGALSDLGRKMTDVIGVSMPCFGTSGRTRRNAHKLCELLGVTFREIDITNSVRSHLKDIGHKGEKNPDIAFENAQARERTQVIMDIANMENGLVVGTGDMSEMALGWSTYNGDHMSMYGVNCGVPKTLVRHLVRFAADESADDLKKVLYDILSTPVSPELLPSNGKEITQKTEDIVGPYELHDFFLYYFVRWGFDPAKIFRIARYSFGDDYTADEIRGWLRVFVRRFFTNQFKRSCIPNGPKVGSVGLSPRGDWRMPSDASSALWADYLK